MSSLSATSEMRDDQSEIEMEQQEQIPAYVRQPVDWNFEKPVAFKDGVLFVPRFIPIEFGKKTTSTADLEMRTAKDAEIPSLLLEAGELTAQEDADIDYTRAIPGQRIYVGKPDSAVFVAKYYNEAMICNMGQTTADFMRLRELLAMREEGDTEGPSKFEKIHPKGRDDSRAYSRGFTIDQHQVIHAAVITKEILKDPEFDAEISRLVFAVANSILRSAVPAEELALVDQHADVVVPLTFGSVENKTFTTYHVNVSTIGNANIQLDVGTGGGLHLDALDDYRRWTVLMSLGNINEGDWPGRTLITSLRVYVVLAPLTAVVFKAVQPHISKGPVPMGTSSRQPYVPSAAVPLLDAEKFALSRISCAVYPKKAIIDRSPFSIRTDTPLLLRAGADAANSMYPDMLGVAIHAFGTRKNQYTWHAKSFAINRATAARGNTSTIVPSASVIADSYCWLENGVICRPSVAAIQKVLNAFDGNNQQHRDFLAKFAVYEKNCAAIRSIQHFGSNKRANEGNFVSTDQIGSSLQNLSLEQERPAESSKAAKGKAPDKGKGVEKAVATEEGEAVASKPAKLKAEQQRTLEFGEKPFGCPYCDRRWKKKAGYKSHHNTMHKDREWVDLVPSVDPEIVKHKDKKRKREDEDEGEEEVAEEE